MTKFLILLTHTLSDHYHLPKIPLIRPRVLISDLCSRLRLYSPHAVLITTREETSLHNLWKMSPSLRLDRTIYFLVNLEFLVWNLKHFSNLYYDYITLNYKNSAPSHTVQISNLTAL
jgi:hypothetical protein